jgi:hypothetical protein
MVTIRSSLASAIAGLFLAGAVSMALGFVATLFLREIPLRRGHHPEPAAAEPL